MDVNYTYCGAHLKIHANKEPHCPSQASVIVYVSYTSIKQMGERELSHLSPSFCGMVALLRSEEMGTEWELMWVHESTFMKVQLKLPDFAFPPSYTQLLSQPPACGLKATASRMKTTALAILLNQLPRLHKGKHTVSSLPLFLSLCIFIYQ